MKPFSTIYEYLENHDFRGADVTRNGYKLFKTEFGFSFQRPADFEAKNPAGLFLSPGRKTWSVGNDNPAVLGNALQQAMGEEVYRKIKTTFIDANLRSGLDYNDVRKFFDKINLASPEFKYYYMAPLIGSRDFLDFVNEWGLKKNWLPADFYKFNAMARNFANNTPATVIPSTVSPTQRVINELSVHQNELGAAVRKGDPEVARKIPDLLSSILTVLSDGYVPPNDFHLIRRNDRTLSQTASGYQFQTSGEQASGLGGLYIPADPSTDQARFSGTFTDQVKAIHDLAGALLDHLNGTSPRS